MSVTMEMLSGIVTRPSQSVTKCQLLWRIVTVITIRSSFFSLRTSRSQTLFCDNISSLLAPATYRTHKPATTRPFKSDRRRTEGRRSTFGRREGWRRTGGRRSAPSLLQFHRRRVGSWRGQQGRTSFRPLHLLFSFCYLPTFLGWGG